MSETAFAPTPLNCLADIESEVKQVPPLPLPPPLHPLLNLHRPLPPSLPLPHITSPDLEKSERERDRAMLCVMRIIPLRLIQ